jgi:ubiquinone biosynthesis protein COQ9
MIQEIPGATSAVERIGVASAVVIILLIGGAYGLRALFRYFTERLDKKDAQVIKLMDERREDLRNIERTIARHVEGQKEITAALRVLAARVSGQR